MLMTELSEFETEWIPEDLQYRLYYVENFPLGRLRTLIQVIPAKGPKDLDARLKITAFALEYLEGDDI
tara:strand:+ start:21 stop:224 length:204 start_codon:yes stop_codon:yes gene_type:complete